MAIELCARCLGGRIVIDLAGGKSCLNCGHVPTDDVPAERPRTNTTRWDRAVLPRVAAS